MSSDQIIPCGCDYTFSPLGVRLVPKSITLRPYVPEGGFQSVELFQWFLPECSPQSDPVLFPSRRWSEPTAWSWTADASGWTTPSPSALTLPRQESTWAGRLSKTHAGVASVFSHALHLMTTLKLPVAYLNSNGGGGGGGGRRGRESYYERSSYDRYDRYDEYDYRYR